MKQKHRTFIAINLPEKIKNNLEAYQEKWPELPGRWTKPRNIHITLVFIGYADNDELMEVCKIAKEVASRHEPFFIDLKRICYGPLDKIPPKMVWAMGKKSGEFTALRQDLEKSLMSSEKVSYSLESREFSPHITLCRLREWQWKRIDPEERPNVEEDINFNFSVNSIEVMESELKRGGAEYIVLESASLGQ